VRTHHGVGKDGWCGHVDENISCTDVLVKVIFVHNDIGGGNRHGR